MSGEFLLKDFPIGLLVTQLDSNDVLMASPYFYQLCQQQPLSNAKLGGFFTSASKILLESFVMPMLLHQGHCDEIQLTLETSANKSGVKQRIPVLANARVIAGEPTLVYWAISTSQQRDTLYQQLVDLRNDLEVRAEKLEVLSQTDELTGLLNRRAFSQRAVSLIKQAQRSEVTYAFFMLDIDYFKQINDQHGHAVGDEVLKDISTILSNNTRTNDIVARIGGEEFAIITFDQAEDAAKFHAEKLLTAIRQQPIQGIQVTASLGCAIAGNLSFEQLYKDADALLYQAKHQGRDRALCHFFDVC
jgi:diguanylate cyclase (GGDEF)-like protein